MPIQMQHQSAHCFQQQSQRSPLVKETFVTLPGRVVSLQHSTCLLRSVSVIPLMQVWCGNGDWGPEDTAPFQTSSLFLPIHLFPDSYLSLLPFPVPPKSCTSCWHQPHILVHFTFDSISFPSFLASHESILDCKSIRRGNHHFFICKCHVIELHYITNNCS